MNATIRPTLISVAEGASQLDVLAARHRAAWDKTQHGRSEWIEGTLELAAVLAEEKKLLPDTTDFSRWLERNQLANISHQDRAALINMAGDLAVTRDVLEKTQRFSWREIWEKELQARVTSLGNSRQAPKIQKRRTKSERQIIERVLDLQRRGFTYDETAEDIGLTRGQVAGIVKRNRPDTKPEATPVPPKREFTGLKTLTKEQVDPDFVGTDLEFRTKYGHVPMQTKQEIEHHKRQQELQTWLGAISDLERTVKAFVKVPAPDPETFRQWMIRPNKADMLGARLSLIESAWLTIAPCLELIRNGGGSK